MTSPTDIFSFIDYRAYLKVLYQNLKETRPYFSYRYFSRVAGFGSQSYLRMVMDGQRNLTPESITKFTRGLKLNRRETVYFEALVFYNQASSEEERDRYFSQLIALRPRTKMEGLTKDQFEYLTDNLFVIIREMASLHDFQENPAWIASRFSYPVKTSRIQHALKVLEHLKLLVRDKNNKLKHSGRTLKSPLDVESIEVLNYHRRIISESKDVVMTAPFDKWDISSVTLPLSLSTLPPIMEIMRKAVEDIVDYVNKNKKSREAIYQLNYQLFPVTRIQSR